MEKETSLSPTMSQFEVIALNGNLVALLPLST
jgi:hypothetical protein